MNNVHQRPSNACPEEMTPQVKAHMGANQVTGLNNSRTADGSGHKRLGADDDVTDTPRK